MDSALHPHEDGVNKVPVIAYYIIFTAQFDGKGAIVETCTVYS